MKTSDMTYQKPYAGQPSNEINAMLPDGTMLNICAQYNSVVVLGVYESVQHSPSCACGASAYAECTCNHNARVAEANEARLQSLGLTVSEIIADARVRGQHPVTTREMVEREDINSGNHGYCPKCHSYCYGDCSAN